MHVNIKKVPISADDFSPRVLKSGLFKEGMSYPKGYRLDERHVYDYELEFFTDSDGAMYIEDTLYPIRKGDIVFRKPGQYTQAIMPYCCYIICIDLLGNTGKDIMGYDITHKQDFQTYYVNSILDTLPPVFHPSAGEKYFHLFDTVLKEFINPRDSSALLLKSYVLQILYQFYQDVQNTFHNTTMPPSPHYVTLKKVISHIEANFDSPISLDKLAALAGLSTSHFHKIFTATLGITPHEFVIKTRLAHAKELLVKTNHTVTDIAVQCGFENTPYFSYLFKKMLGISPGEFRKRHSYV